MNKNLPLFTKTRLAILIAILTNCTFLSLFAESVSRHILDIKVSINVREQTLKETLDLISAKTSVPLIYSNTKELFNSSVTINVQDKPLRQILDEILSPYPLNYKVIDEKIVIIHQEKAKSNSLNEIIKSPNKNGLKGKITDESGNPLTGATVSVIGDKNIVITDSNGEFTLENISLNTIIHITYIGYKTKEIKIHDFGYMAITLEADSSKLDEVVVSTGYQTLPAERATGSFVQIDNNLINRSVSTDIISRLQDVTSGLNFDRRGGGQPYLDIRSRGTILANDQPLIVLDNFPYDGDINNINPNDVQSITVLKDAAAASIWGVRAGNGVIVITTKKGQFNQPLKVEFNANLNLGQKPDLSKLSWISSSDYIDLEKNLFSQGYYDAKLSNTTNPPALTPVVELLAAVRNGTITQAAADAQINTLKQFNVQGDMKNYLYRTSANQQYSLNLNGGIEKQKYYFSVGYDKNLDNIINNGNDRLTLRAANTFRPIKNLELNTDLIYTRSQTKDNGLGYSSISQGTSGIYPYARLADNDGNALPIEYNYSNSFTKTAATKGLLNWQYVPLSEIKNADNKVINSDLRFNTSAKYNILSYLSASVLYTYERQEVTGTNLFSQDTYYTRNLINSFTTVNADGSLTNNIPLGSILQQNYATINSNDIRAQLNLDKSWTDKRISAIAGYEVRQVSANGSGFGAFGYDNNNLTSNSQIDYKTFFSTYNGNYAQIPYQGSGFSGLFSGNVSYYSNAAFTYKDRYTFSGSARFDQSNLFGVNTNQKGVPLWSVGGSWEVNKESFYKVDWLTYLKLRATFGYNGNLDQNLSALTTANYQGYAASGLASAGILNPPNPELRWEKSAILNLGVDFAITKNIISGSLEYFHKKGTDLLGYAPVDPTTGVTSFEGNVANNEGNGFDIQLNAHILNGSLKWTTNLLYSYAIDKVTKYLSNNVNGANYVGIANSGRYVLPLVGKPAFGIYSYKWAGLDPANGNPRGYLPDGTISENYSTLMNVTPTQLVYNGPARPTSFGSLRNTFSCKQFSISANIAYEFDFYFVKPSVNYNNLFGNAGILTGSDDYANRWQKPGDENTTNVPSFIYPFNTTRDLFYAGSSALVEKGSNIRLRDVNISYDLAKSQWRSMPFQIVHFYVYANNLGIIWRANKSGIDPDSPILPIPRTLAVGLKADF